MKHTPKTFGVHVENNTVHVSENSKEAVFRYVGDTEYRLSTINAKGARFIATGVNKGEVLPVPYELFGPVELQLLAKYTIDTAVEDTRNEIPFVFEDRNMYDTSAPIKNKSKHLAV